MKKIKMYFQVFPDLKKELRKLDVINPALLCNRDGSEETEKFLAENKKKWEELNSSK